MKKIFLSWGIVFLILSGFFFLKLPIAEANSEETILVNIHKYLNTYEYPEGNETRIPICEAGFTGFDLTDEFYNSEMDQETFREDYMLLSFSELRQLLSEKNIPVLSKSGDTSAVVYTNENGIASWKVNSQKNSKDSVYLFIETEKNEATKAFEEYSQPIMLFLPAIDKETGMLMPVVDLFPKPISYSCTPYFFKYGRRSDGTELRLSDTKFVLSRMKNGQKEYWSVKQPNNLLINDWVSSENPREDSQVRKFVSDENGLVSLGNYVLSIGNYMFEEVETKSGYQIDFEAKNIEVQVKGNPETGMIDTILINNEALEKNALGNVSKKVISIGRPRIYNTEKELSDDSSKSQKGGKLPNTGEINSVMLILGILLIFLVFNVWHQRKQN